MKPRAAEPDSASPVPGYGPGAPGRCLFGCGQVFRDQSHVDPSADVPAAHSVAVVGMDSVFWWLVPLMSNLLGVFFICYLIMWFAVPAARTARQKARTKRTADYRTIHRGGFGGESRCRCRCQTGRCQGRLCLGAGRPDRIETPGRLAGIRVDSGCMRIDYRSVCCRDGRSGGCVCRCGHLDGVAGDYDRVGAGAVADLCVDVPDCFPQTEPPGRPDDFPNLDIDYYRPGCFCGPGA